ncbi:Crs1 yhby domain containing protein [Musa troglodytarum]|uniref:Crs1 yhby domain containing protein n=1 Tax=Musa troglodytarum TaxID=320322 RepID=A0A9E7JZX7_9LILI|nr:Crs1 yhby domain containing protein [Musa troglodytarum]
MASSVLRFHLPRPHSSLLLSSSSIPHKLSSPLLLLLPFSSPSSSSSPRFLLSSSHRLFSSLSPSPPPPHPLHLQSDLRGQDSDFEDPEEDDSHEESELENEAGEDTGPVVAVPLPRLPSPKLSIKEKKELASYAHSLGKKLKSQQVGKSGVTPSVAAAFVETLEANELLKLKVHGSCPGELSDVIKQLEQATGSVVVGQIGRSVILYRPSLSKMQKKEAQNTRNTWNAKSPKPVGTSKMHRKRKVFARSSR